MKSTKTTASAVLAVDPGTVGVLRSWRQERQAQHLAVGAGGSERRTGCGPIPCSRIRCDLITSRTGGEPSPQPTARTVSACTTSATHLIAVGIDPRTVAGRLRHASPAMTLDVYAGRDLGADCVAADTTGRLLDG